MTYLSDYLVGFVEKRGTKDARFKELIYDATLNVWKDSDGQICKEPLIFFRHHPPKQVTYPTTVRMWIQKYVEYYHSGNETLDLMPVNL